MNVYTHTDGRSDRPYLYKINSMTQMMTAVENNNEFFGIMLLMVAVVVVVVDVVRLSSK